MVSYEKILEDATVAVMNAHRNPTVASLMARYGYNDARFEQGMGVIQTARNLLNLERLADEEKVTAGKSFDEKLEAGQAKFDHDASIVQTVVKPLYPKHAVLKLMKPRAKGYPRKQAQFSKFYDYLLQDAELQAILAEWGLTLEEIVSGVEMAKAIAEAYQATYNQRGNASDLRRQREEAFKTLARWYTSFCTFARLALVSRPELLASLGIPATARKRPTKKSTTPEPTPQPPVDEPVSERPSL